MKMIIDRKELVKKYFKGYCWLLLYDKPDATSEVKKVIERVNTKMQDMEIEIRRLLSGEEIDRLLERARDFLNTPVGNLTEKQLIFLCQLIFGKNLRVSLLEKKIPFSVSYFDPAKYDKK